MSTLISTLPRSMAARMRIGSAMSASATSDGDLDLLDRVEVLPVREDERVDIGGFGHLDAGRYEGIGTGGNVEIRRERVRVLLDQDRYGLRLRKRAFHGDRNDRAVFGDVRRGDLDAHALGRTAGAERLEGVGDAPCLEGGFVPFQRERFRRPDQPDRHRPGQRSRSAPCFQHLASPLVHALSDTGSIRWFRFYLDLAPRNTVRAPPLRPAV